MLAGRFSESSRVVAVEDVVSCDLAGGAALLDLRTSTYFSLSPVGSHIWALLGQPVAVSDLRDAVTAEYAVEPERCLADILTLLEQLESARLVRVADASLG